MPRRNRTRREFYEPLDLTSDKPPPSASLGRNLPRYEIEHRMKLQKAEQQIELVRRQEIALAERGIDWGVCLVPGCGKALGVYRDLSPSWPEDRDTSRHLPLCVDHAVIAWRQIQERSHLPNVIEATVQTERREHDHFRAKMRQAAEKRSRHAGDGLIYFVRINDLVKVGWTKDFYRRLKEYGAGAEVLCHYPATRAEETDLHRQLRSVLAKGREWYHDGDVIELFVRQAIERHGPPTILKADWTEPRSDVIKLRRR